jgi:hypothetical protein
MRGPVGLLVPPATGTALVRLAVPHADGGIIVHIDPRFLEAPYLKRGRLLFAIEGFGRFWLQIEGAPSHSGTAE